MSATPHPAESYEADFEAVQKRAKLAMAALALTVLVRVYNIPVRLWQSGLLNFDESHPADTAAITLSETLTQYGAVAELGVLVLTGVLFLRWLHMTARLTIAFGGESLKFSARDAVTGFIIPFVNFTRPYQIVRDVHDALAPDMVPEPPVQVQSGEAQGYRDVQVVAPPAPVKLPHASIGAWWGFFWVGNLVANMTARQNPHTPAEFQSANVANNFGDMLDVVSATLALLVVRSVTARLMERYRRVRHNPVEVLDAAGITVG